MTTATLTPVANQTPAVANATKELSGPVWVTRFPGSIDTDALTPEFKICVDTFIAAIQAGGGHVSISNTFRPVQRAYMMHWCYAIFRNGFDPANVPPFPGVAIEWVHPTLAQSVHAAKKMLEDFQMMNLNTSPALQSLHSVRKAIDMRIWWSNNLSIRARNGDMVVIDTMPRTGMNVQLKEVGATYGVIKYVNGAADKPHWSTTGH
jgi:hypothetical protein